MLFVHDHTFVRKDTEYYTTGSLNNKIMNRYKRWFNDVTIFANYREYTDSDKTFIKEENKVENVTFKVIKKNNKISYLIKIRKEIAKEVMNSECIVIRMSLYGAIATYYARKYNKPYLIEMVACPWDSLWNHSIKGKIFAPFMTICTKIIVKRAPYVLYVTNEFLQKRYPTKGINIGCSDVELFNIDSKFQLQKIDKIKKMDLKNIKLCTVANVNVKYKGQDSVIKSISLLNKKGIKCDYYLVGAGNQDRLRKIAKKYNVEEQVIFIGPKPHNEIFEIFDDIDIYVQPSFQEGLPRAVIEAMSKSCPIIGSNAGGIPELIDKKYIFKKGNYKQLADIILNIRKEDLLVESKKNFENSKIYDKNVLDLKREAFYLNFFKETKNGR